MRSCVRSVSGGEVGWAADFLDRQSSWPWRRYLVATAGDARAQSGDDGAWEPTRPADGQPDISGVRTNFDPTPFEAPDDVDLERCAPLATWFPGGNWP